MKKLLSVLLIAILVVFACGPSLETENANWKKNLEAMELLKTEYPVYKALIEQKTEEAKKIWDEASKISNEDQKLDKIVSANNLLEENTIGNLRHMKNKISDLKTKKESLLGMKTPNYQIEQRAKNAFVSVDDALKNADEVIYLNQQDIRIDEATSKIDKAWTSLNDAYKEVEIIIDNINRENKAIADEKNQTEQKLNQEKQKADEAVADIKCPYCGTMNVHDYKKCKSCGAPKE
jgi:hypothetical protein